ncbi:MAG: NUDIX hydrolase [Sphaerochaetaceae bacterium]|nr:NUDIX hydrolase [Sphaerochaetaceae bacterium]
MYAFLIETKAGQKGTYSVASRASEVSSLDAVTKKTRGDVSAVFAIYGEAKDHVVLIKQYRFPLNDYVYEFPAGLIENGESLKETAIRELFEETGLEFVPENVNEAFTRPYYSSVGMSDESVGIVYGYAKGTPNTNNKEVAEDIEVVIADRDMCKQILRKEKVSLLCAYMLMAFIHSKGENPFAFTEEI